LAGGIFARLASRNGIAILKPAPAQSAQNLTLSKEYIYAGGRLVATEQPPAAAAPCAPSSSVNVIISEFRFRGPQGANDEFIELYNASDSPVSVCASDGSSGWTLASRTTDGAPAELVTVPNGTNIPARGHYLSAGSGYSLGTNTNGARFDPPDANPTWILNPPTKVDQLSGAIMESGNTLVSSLPGNIKSNIAKAQIVLASATSLTRLTANSNSSYATDTADNAGAALFSTSNPSNFTAERRLDAAGFSSMSGANADLYREGAGLAPISGNGEYSFVRKLASGYPQDTNNNSADFYFVSTTGGTFGGVVSVLGAPGPENLSSPINRNLAYSLFDPAVAQSSAPNRIRCSTCTSPNAQYGTLAVLRTFTNNSNQTVTRLRFRLYDLTTLNSPGYVAGGAQADMRVLNSSDITVTRSDGSTVTVRGTVVETPPDQPNGGGLNTILLLPLSDAGLRPGESISAQFLLGVQQNGYYRFYSVMEALP